MPRPRTTHPRSSGEGAATRPSLRIEDVVLLGFRRDRPRRVDLTIGADGRVSRLVAAGSTDSGPAPRERLRGAGMLCLPAFAVAHHHLYSALAVGMPPPRPPPADFLQILERIWWVLDRCLDLETVRLSACLGAMRAARQGVGTLFDHHASPRCIEGSLAAVAAGVDAVGLRGVYAYEVTDRNGEAQAEEGLAENLGFLRTCRAAPADPAGPRRGAVLGAHASFTLSDRTLDALAEHASLGLHVHVGEDPVDRALSRSRYGAAPVARMQRRGLLGPRSLVVHGVDLTPREQTTLAETGATLVHNYRSNANNAVGTPKAHDALARGVALALGTDGLDGSFLSELTAAFLAGQASGLGRGWELARSYLLGNAALTARHLPGVQLEEVAVGQPADLTLWRYPAAREVVKGRGLGHLLFGLEAPQLHATMVGGRFAYRDGAFPSLGDPGPVEEEARARMRTLWRRMEVRRRRQARPRMES